MADEESRGMAARKFSGTTLAAIPAVSPLKTKSRRVIPEIMLVPPLWI
jgi:hypothetical protein